MSTLIDDSPSSFGLTKFVEINAINEWCGLTMGSNVREIARPEIGGIIRNYIYQIGLSPQHYDIWIYDRDDDKLIETTASDALAANRTVLVLVHKGLGLKQDQALTAFKKLSPIMPSKIWNQDFFTGS